MFFCYQDTQDGATDVQSKLAFEWSDTESNINSPPEDFGLGSITSHPRTIVPASLSKTALDSDSDLSMEGDSQENIQDNIQGRNGNLNKGLAEGNKKGENQAGCMV